MEILTQKDEGNKSSDIRPEIPVELPILVLRGNLVYPSMVMPLSIEQANLIQLVHDVALSPSRVLGLVAIKDDRTEGDNNNIYTMGTAATVLRLFHVPDNTVRLIVQGLEKIRIKEFTSTEPYLKAKVEVVSESMAQNKETEALMRNTIELLRRMVALAPHLPEELLMAALNVDEPRQLVYIIATNLRMDLNNAQKLLELNTIEDKLMELNKLLGKEIEILELGKKIQSQTQTQMEKNQRSYILREQLKQIKKELGEEDDETNEINEYQEKILTAHMPSEAGKEASRELQRMQAMTPASAEYHIIKTYLDWLIEIPWEKRTEDNLDITRARKILDEDHYDMKEIKERLLEYLAVRKLRSERDREEKHHHKGSILCFVGPPGVGKTSLGQSIARALGRKFIRMSLGGVHDESEIRGHRRTYIGAMPGRIIQSIKRAGSRNPVMMLDEIDKIGSDFRGDPSSALLEVLDPEQNKTFADHYLDVDFDLSEVIFICTANQLEPIQPALRDRMEIIKLAGYTEEEKVHIAKQYLIPRQIPENGLTAKEIKFKDRAIRKIVREYTREAGVRNLEREIESLCRKVATLVAENNRDIPIVVTPEKVEELLGKPKYYSEIAERTTLPGVATGLAVTPLGGGDILFIEATKMLGSKRFIITGQLGEVMKESAQAALSYVRSKAHELGIAEELFEKNDIHIHIPAGATPKDGPSAGVTMATALASLMTNRLINSEVGMTGEITLRGKVLPVGGIKEKVLAAHRAGLKKVIIPKRNAKDLEDLPEEVRQEMEFILAKDVSDVFAAALNPEAKS
ncbi:endopeptidase La [Legionella sp. 27cVA30]|uniref:endopeptidase La n=1 Tax=Legionella sp. 27cVA30 TaxID=2905657 RepID=UPI00209D96F3|nr:endopeptidase La [Legionella sp. 27cVA30]MCP0913712.1 endopeptidase La [Legionella sp. 27cVA30]